MRGIRVICNAKCSSTRKVGNNVETELRHLARSSKKLRRLINLLKGSAARRLLVFITFPCKYCRGRNLLKKDPAESCLRLLIVARKQNAHFPARKVYSSPAFNGRIA